MAANPYEAPQSRVADIDDEAEHQPIRLWSASGRIGRLRYLAYTSAATVLVLLISGVLSLALGPMIGTTVTLLLYIPLLVFCLFAAIQRSHDMNWTGWTILLSIIPLVGLIWLFNPGSTGANKYGGPPPPNTLGVKLMAFTPIVMIALMAAVAIPAYQSYVERAQQQGASFEGSAD